MHKRRVKKFITIALALLIVLSAAALGASRYIHVLGSKYTVSALDCPGSQAAIVLGAYVSPQGRLCDMLADRVETAVELYRAGSVDKIIMTGDHGRTNYDEVNHMRLYAEGMGVPTGDIFMDHAGFSTYDSMYRARDVFKVSTAVVVTQNFHLPRAVYTARSLGLQAVGVSADKHIYAGAEYYGWREVPARVKAFGQLHLVRSKPQFLGEAIPVSGDGRLTHDDFSHSQ